MPYVYQEEKPKLLTDAGQRLFLRFRDRTQQLLKTSGAARAHELMAGFSGDSWVLLACIDRLVELGELRLIEQADHVATQAQIYVGRA
jgi:hypothetical protein